MLQRAIYEYHHPGFFSWEALRTASAGFSFTFALHVLSGISSNPRLAGCAGHAGHAACGRGARGACGVCGVRGVRGGVGCACTVCGVFVHCVRGVRASVAFGALRLRAQR